METLKKLRIFNGNTLKILAAIFMFLDHFGLLFFREGTLANAWLRGFGRLSMPLFAFMIAEGCRYTKNKVKHFFLLFGLGAACQIVYIIFDPHTMYLGILLTFSISTLIIYAMQYAKKCFFDDSVGFWETSAACGLFFGLVGGVDLHEGNLVGMESCVLFQVFGDGHGETFFLWMMVEAWESEGGEGKNKSPLRGGNAEQRTHGAGRRRDTTSIYQTLTGMTSWGTHDTPAR
jgi:hypothetical protein